MGVSHRFSTDRVQALSDGIFAIAMTLLVLTLDVPQLPPGSTQSDLAAALAGMGSRLWVVVMSFLLLGIFWRVHHSQYHKIRYTTDGLVWLNLLSLLFVVLLPFSTELMGTYGDLPLACVVFDTNMVLIGMLSLAQWRYAVHARLLGPDVSEQAVRVGTLRNLMIPVIGVMGIALSFFVAADSNWVYVLAIPASALLRNRAEHDVEHAVERSGEQTVADPEVSQP